MAFKDLWLWLCALPINIDAKIILFSGMDSDLLIHEATMEDDLIGEAKFKLHSTLSQAIGVGKLIIFYLVYSFQYKEMRNFR